MIAYPELWAKCTIFSCDLRSLSFFFLSSLSSLSLLSCSAFLASFKKAKARARLTKHDEHVYEQLATHQRDILNRAKLRSVKSNRPSWAWADVVLPRGCVKSDPSSWSCHSLSLSAHVMEKGKNWKKQWGRNIMKHYETLLCIAKEPMLLLLLGCWSILCIPSASIVAVS